MGKTNFEELTTIATEIGTCELCSLAKTATNPVPGNGDPNALILFIGEAPGFTEDQQGIPFCGRSGKLLDELLASIGLNRSQVFVANMLKHRPPDNRDPLPEEITVCKKYLDRQIEIINPKLIVTLGRFSMTKFLPEGRISRDHGMVQTILYNQKSYRFIPLYHPAAALRTTEVDRQLRADFLTIANELNRLSMPKVETRLQKPVSALTNSTLEQPGLL